MVGLVGRTDMIVDRSTERMDVCRNWNPATSRSNTATRNRCEKHPRAVLRGHEMELEVETSHASAALSSNRPSRRRGEILKAQVVVMYTTS